MIKVIMKRVPKKFDQSTPHKIMKNWSSVIVETYAPTKSVKIISAKEVVEAEKKQATNSEIK